LKEKKGAKRKNNKTRQMEEERARMKRKRQRRHDKNKRRSHGSKINNEEEYKKRIQEEEEEHQEVGREEVGDEDLIDTRAEELLSLFHPLSFRSFLSLHWTKRFPLHLSSPKFPLSPLLSQIKSHLSSSSSSSSSSLPSDRLYFFTDVRRIGWDSEDKAIIEATPSRNNEGQPLPFSLDSSICESLSDPSEGGSLVIKNLDLVTSPTSSSPLVSLLQLLDANWARTTGRHSSSTASATLRSSFSSSSPSNEKIKSEGWGPFPPYSCSEDQLLLQLEGRQRVSLVDETLLKESVPSFPELDLHGGHQPFIIYEFDPNADLDEESLFTSDASPEYVCEHNFLFLLPFPSPPLLFFLSMNSPSFFFFFFLLFSPLLFL
jgi:hypothetical protein